MYLSRRSFLEVIGTAALAHAAGVSAAGVAAASGGVEAYADTAAADLWMKKWMTAFKSANKPLHMGRFADPTYFLLKDVGWTPNPGQTMTKVDVPSGFVTDFASIPRVFWSILRPDGDYTYPAIVHDFLYWDQSVSRKEADDVLKAAMEDFKVDSAKIATIYAGVRSGGSFAWNSNAKLKQAGEKRILKKFPADPTVRWADWKKQPGVFG